MTLIPGPILQIGNTNSRLRFALGPAEFVNRCCEEGPTHRRAICVGAVEGVIRKFARLSGIDGVDVC